MQRLTLTKFDPAQLPVQSSRQANIEELVMPIYPYTTLDDPSGTLGTFARGINTSGQIAGYYVDSSNSSHGFLLSGGTYTALDDPLANAVAGGTAV